MVEKLQSRRPPNSILQIRIFGTDNRNVIGGGGGEPGRHVLIALKSSPKSGQNMAKSAQIEREFLKKCLEYRNSARTLPVVFNYFLADAHKYSQFS